MDIVIIGYLVFDANSNNTIDYTFLYKMWNTMPLLYIHISAKEIKT